MSCNLQVYCPNALFSVVDANFTVHGHHVHVKCNCRFILLHIISGAALLPPILDMFLPFSRGNRSPVFPPIPFFPAQTKRRYERGELCDLKVQRKPLCLHDEVLPSSSSYVGRCFSLASRNTITMERCSCRIHDVINNMLLILCGRSNIIILLFPSSG